MTCRIRICCWAGMGLLLGTFAACGDDSPAFTAGTGGTTSAGTGGGGTGGTGGAIGGGGTGGTGGVSPTCGDGMVDSGEQCDDGTANSDTAPDACRLDCTPPGCGDGVLDYLTTPTEQCDDGNTVAGDGCDATCQIEPPPTCGDGNVDLANGEECDDGNTVGGDGCSPACLIEAPPTCGDGNLDLDNDEQCDDGNTVGGDGCGPNCQIETVGATCGNGSVEGLEICDDSNLQNGDGCNPTCNLTNTTSHFAGTLGSPGFADGLPGTGRIGGWGTLAVDATYLYLGDGGNRIVRRITINPGQADDGNIQTLAGVPTPGTTQPVPVDHADGTQAVFRGIESIATDGHTMWVCGAQQIRAIDLTDPQLAVSTLAGDWQQASCVDGNGLGARFNDIRGCTYWNGHVYLLDSVCAILRRFDPATGDVVTLAGVNGTTGTQDGSGVGGTAPFGLLVSPRYMAHDNSGILYIADTNGVKIRSYNTVTNYLGTYAGTGSCGYSDGIGTAAEIRRPRQMTSDGTSIYWASQNEQTVRQGVLLTQSVTTLAGQHCSGASCTGSCPGGYAEGVGTAAQFTDPMGIAYHYPTNALFVVDSGNAIIRRIE